METFTKLFGSLLLFVYHCLDRIVINGFLTNLSRSEQVVYFFRQVLGIAVVSKEVLSQRTSDYRTWVESFARNHGLPIEWAEKGVRKEDHVLPALRLMEKKNAFGVYFIFRSMEQGRTFRVSVPTFATQDPNHRIPRTSAAGSRIITSTFATSFSGRSSCAWPAFSRPTSRIPGGPHQIRQTSRMGQAAHQSETG
ncbi:MAG: hypothetical protein QOJ99_5662 [Bryobacterales bacterium]|jgi:hypothetical protein|nr:hypothetical protein [Bryobacterales bacterium]